MGLSCQDLSNLCLQNKRQVCAVPHCGPDPILADLINSAHPRTWGPGFEALERLDL